MEVQIIVEYKGKSYESEKIKDLKEKDIIELENTIEAAVRGALSCYSMDNGDTRQYFPRRILRKSIISIYRFNN